VTTIATDGRIMAADGRTSGGGTIYNDASVKMTRLPDGSIVGRAGGVADHTKAVDELIVAMLEERTPRETKGDYALLRLFKDGKALLYVDRLDGPAWVSLPAAVGSGADYARGAMAMGADPKTAVKIAKRFDAGSGGRIRTLSPR